MSLVEALVATLIISLVVAGVGGSTISWLRSERLRSASYVIHSQLSLARTEAANRNRPCRFEFDIVTRRISVVDLGDTSTSADDETIGFVTLDSRVDLAVPTPGAPVTMTNISGNTFGATFAQDGTVSDGSGFVGLFGNGMYRRISVFAAGGVATESWNGSSWVTH